MISCSSGWPLGGDAGNNPLPLIRHGGLNIQCMRYAGHSPFGQFATRDVSNARYQVRAPRLYGHNFMATSNLLPEHTLLMLALALAIAVPFWRRCWLVRSRSGHGPTVNPSLSIYEYTS
jgi:hypothetical protein